MSDRKYRQRGYQDDDRDRGPSRDKPRPPQEQEPRGRPREPRAPNMPGFHTVLRCFRCGNVGDSFVGSQSTCAKCGAELHSCAQCMHFDPAARFECTQPITARIAPKDAPNECTFYEARTTVERETRSAGPPDLRKAFDDLFK